MQTMRTLNPFRERISKPVDAAPLFKELYRLKETGQDDKLRRAVDGISEAMHDHGRQLLERAFKEGVLKPSEWHNWGVKYGVDYGDADSILTPYYWRKDGRLKKDDVPTILTVNGSPIDKMRRVIKQRFGVKVFNQTQYVMYNWDSADAEARTLYKEKLGVKSRADLKRKMEERKP